VRTYTFPQVRPPGDGPWTTEPDKAHWVDPTTGLDCLIVRAHHGALCGYVGVPPGHPLYEVGPWDPRPQSLAVHGGINFGSHCQEGAEDGPGVCHVPEAGRPADVWWLGFDCAHMMDLAPTLRHQMDELLGPFNVRAPAALVAAGMTNFIGEHYRTFPWVRRQVTRLAAQIHAWGRGISGPGRYALFCYGRPCGEYSRWRIARQVMERHIRSCPRGPMPWARSIRWHRCAGERGLWTWAAASRRGGWLNHRIDMIDEDAA
jgi:hypothetical protein